MTTHTENGRERERGRGTKKTNETKRRKEIHSLRHIDFDDDHFLICPQRNMTGVSSLSHTSCSYLVKLINLNIFLQKIQVTIINERENWCWSHAVDICLFLFTSRLDSFSTHSVHLILILYKDLIMSINKNMYYASSWTRRFL